MKDAFIATGTQKSGEINEGDVTCDYDVLMTQCISHNITKTQYELMALHRDEVGLIGLRDSCVTNELLDQLGICSTPGAVDRDSVSYKL